MVKRFGEFKTIKQPGLHVLMPLADRMDKVDVREFPRTGDQQAVITKDNVSLWVSATIFCQVTDVKLALFEVNDFGLAIDQMARTALRAVFGELTLDESLSERETINSKMQDHMAEATLKWGVRLNRIEILDITPPTNVLQAMSEQKEAEQHKRAAILKSEGEQQAAINSAQGRKQANVLEAEGQKQASILAAEAQKQVLELRADGEKRAAQLRGEGEAAALDAIDKVGINPNTLAIMQLRALQAVATSPNAKVVVPYEAAGLVGAASVLVDAMKDAGGGHRGARGRQRQAGRLSGPTRRPPGDAAASAQRGAPGPGDERLGRRGVVRCRHHRVRTPPWLRAPCRRGSGRGSEWANAMTSSGTSTSMPPARPMSQAWTKQSMAGKARPSATVRTPIGVSRVASEVDALDGGPCRGRRSRPSSRRARRPPGRPVGRRWASRGRGRRGWRPRTRWPSRGARARRGPSSRHTATPPTRPTTGIRSTTDPNNVEAGEEHDVGGDGHGASIAPVGTGVNRAPATSSPPCRGSRRASG